MSKEKPVSDLARTSISLPKSLYEKALQRARELSFASFSDYVQHLLRTELVFRAELKNYPQYPQRDQKEGQPEAASSSSKPTRKRAPAELEPPEKN